MSDPATDAWLDGAPDVVAIIARRDDGVRVRVFARWYGSEVWRRDVNLGHTPSFAIIREITAKLMSEALVVLEGQR